ncbi:MAG: hypothetical protein K8S98_01115 [Planctomycetes bacterium]|nr:hypothetical protein [Planctomycetota bacterium]
MSSSQVSIEPEGRAAAAQVDGYTLWLAFIAVAILLVASVYRANLDRSYGWDESMHAALPAARIVEHVRAGEVRAAFDVVLGCDQYPLVVPVYLAVVESIFGIDESVARHALAAAWAVGLLALAFVAGRLVVGGPWRGRPLWAAAMFTMFAPIGRLYAPTLFLEAPFGVAMIFAILAWLPARDGTRSARRDFAAGALLAFAFFTKFNYGLLLALGFALDGAVDLVLAARRGAVRETLLRFARVATVPLVACLWWFVFPWPGGLDDGASHSKSFAAFLAGNQEFTRVPWTLRLIDWTTLVFPAFLLPVCIVTLFVQDWRASASRCLALVAVAFVVPICLHPFHLDRFLLPAAIPLWALSFAGFLNVDARFVSRRWMPWVLGAIACVTALVVGGWWRAHALDVLGIASPNPKVLEYQQEQIDARDFVSSRIPLPTGGLLRKESDGFLDLVAKAAGPTARIGWIGLSSELSPAAIHLGLLTRGGSIERFLRDAHESMDVTFESADPNWTKEQLAEFASRFDVIFATDPPDMAKRVGRAFEAQYRKRLVEELGWREEELGAVTIEKALQSPYPVRLFACRPPKQ